MTFHKLFKLSKFWFLDTLVAHSYLTLCDPMDCTTHQASLSITNSWSLLKLMSIDSVMTSNHLIFCHPLLLLPSIFPNIRVHQFSSVAHSCPTLCNPINCACQASLSITNSQSPPKPTPIESVMPFNHLILCCPLLLPSSIFPSSGSFPRSQFFASGS